MKRLNLLLNDDELNRINALIKSIMQEKKEHSKNFNFTEMSIANETNMYCFSKKKKSIQFCTTSMGRLFHLKETLIANLKIVELYEDVSIVLLNYNSRDGMNEWIIDNCDRWLQNGKLKYYWTKDPEYFNPSHAKNCVHRQATADILVNLDADNIITKSFIEYIHAVFNENVNTVFQGCEVDTMGRIAMSKDNFYKLGGYDEMFDAYGEEDHDLLCRSKIIGCEIRMLSGLCKWISHDDNIRMANYKNKNKEETNRINMERKFNNLKLKLFNPNEFNGINWGVCNFI